MSLHHGQCKNGVKWEGQKLRGVQSQRSASTRIPISPTQQQRFLCAVRANLNVDMNAGCPGCVFA